MMMKKFTLSLALMLATSWAWSQLTIHPDDKEKAVDCANAATIRVSNSANATFIASVSGGLVIDDGVRERTLVVTNGTSVNVKAATGDGMLFIVDAVTGLNLDTAIVTVNPITVSAVSGSDCINADGTGTYSITPIAGVSYVWVVERGGIQITGGQGTNSVTVQSTSTANSLLKVYVYNSCTSELCVAPRRSKTIRKIFPNPEDGLIGPTCLDPTTLAANDSIIAFFVEPLLGDYSGANNNDYLWNVPGILQPKFTSPDGSARAFKVLNATNDFSVSVTVGALCNPGNILNKNINVPPPTPVMSQTEYCYPSTQTSVTFSVDPSYHQTDFEYQWILPLNWSFADANVNGPSVNVVMNDNAGNVTVIANNAGCGQAQTTFTVNRVISGAAITTTNGACVSYGDVTEKTYSITPPNNNQYDWTLPPGWDFKSGTPVNTASITVIPSGTNGGQITAATQGCGGVSSTIPPIVVELGPVAPTYVSGPTCINGLTPSSILTYSVTNLGAGVTYHWKFPAGWVVNSNGAPADGTFVTTTTNSIAVRFSAARATGTVSVYAKGCIESATTTWQVYDKPATPVLASGTNCPVQGTPTVTYQVNPVFNATYVWSVEQTHNWSAVNPGASSNSAVFNVGNGPSSITVKAVGVEGCTGVESTPLNFPVNVIPVAPVIKREDLGCIAVGRNDTITLKIDNLPLMPAGATYSWTVPPGWTALSPNGSTTQVITNGVANETPGYNVSVTASNALCGGTPGNITIPISAGLNVSITKTAYPFNPTRYSYSVPHATGNTYTWKLFDKNTGNFVSTPVPFFGLTYEVTLTAGGTTQLAENDSLVVEITDAALCTTVIYKVGESAGLAMRSGSSAGRENTIALEGIEETNNDGYSLYPNPAKQKASLTWGALGRQDVKLTVYDMKGVIKNDLLIRNQKKADIDVSDLTPGVYAVLIQTQKGMFFKKIIVEK